MNSNGTFNAYSEYYDLLYRDKDYAGEVDYVEGLLSKFKIGKCRILELGSGTGKHGCIFARRGYQVTGVEKSQVMIANAESHNNFALIQGDACEIDLGQSFDAVISLFHVLSYQVSNTAVSAIFHSAAKHLLPGGVFLFDVWYTPAVLVQRPGVRVLRIESDRWRITRIAEPEMDCNANRVDVTYNIFAEEISDGSTHKLQELHQMRHFSLPEIDFLAEQSGFERVAAEEFMTGAEPGEDSWGVCIVLRRT